MRFPRTPGWQGGEQRRVIPELEELMSALSPCLLLGFLVPSWKLESDPLPTTSVEKQAPRAQVGTASIAPSARHLWKAAPPTHALAFWVQEGRVQRLPG